ncbi:MAG: hypothetical protein RSH26_01200, partial [Clostridia bacterium]
NRARGARLVRLVARGSGGTPCGDRPHGYVPPGGGRPPGFMKRWVALRALWARFALRALGLLTTGDTDRKDVKLDD